MENKQETLEEAAERIAYNSAEENKGFPSIAMFKRGAKWQQQINYSEKEVKNILFEWSMYKLNAAFEDGEIMDYEQWFEQFKNK